MPWACQAGGTLLIPSGPQGSHLFVILNDPHDFPTYRPQSCVLVCVCTIRNVPYDATRIIQPGIHPFIVNPSYVSYRHAKMEIEGVLATQVANGYYVPRESMTNPMRQSLIAGLHESPQTPRYLKGLVFP